MVRSMLFLKRFEKILRLNVLFNRPIVTNAFKSSESKFDYLQCISFDDIRLQKHLKLLCDEFGKIQENTRNGCELENSSNMLFYKFQPIFILIKEIENMKNELKELDTFIAELKDQKDELLSTALQEEKKLRNKLEQYQLDIIQNIIPDDIVDDKDIIMELSAGVGGQEAMLFAKDMFEMYCRYSAWKGWNFEILKYDSTDLGGIRNAHLSISGQAAYKILKFECGVHRVQRIPKTEKSGRLHTSTMAVAILPQPSEIDIILKPQDLELVFKKSKGAGGQSVNTTDSCVRIIHKPTGIVAESQMERCQHKNRALAMKSLRAKLYKIELESIVRETTLSRKLQIGTAGRSEKVRTYNFAQDRITDHRAQIQIFNIEAFFRGDENLNQLLEKLESWNSIQSLNEMLNKYD